MAPGEVRGVAFQSISVLDAIRNLTSVVTSLGEMIFGVVCTLGWLIVNPYLARHEITEHQILRVKSMVAGPV